MHYGGRNQLLLQSINFFLKELSKEAELVFFQNRYNRNEIFFKDEQIRPAYSAGCYTHEDFENFFDDINQDTHYRTLLGLDSETIAKKYGQLHTTYVSSHVELLHYVKTHENVLAIMVKDSFYLMCGFHPTQLWLCGSEYLDIWQLRTKMCDVEALNNTLEFSALQKALFAAILTIFYKDLTVQNLESRVKADNFFSDFEYKQTFPKGKERRISFQIILLAAHYLRNNEMPNSENEPNFPKIVNDIFDDNRNERLETILRKRYESYEIRQVYEEPENTEFEKYRKIARDHPVVYNIFYNRTICLSPSYFSFIDVRPTNKIADKTYAEVILPIYERIMGILSPQPHTNCQVAVSSYFFGYFPQQITEVMPKGKSEALVGRLDN